MAQAIKQGKIELKGNGNGLTKYTIDYFNDESLKYVVTIYSTSTSQQIFNFYKTNIETIASSYSIPINPITDLDSLNAAINTVATAVASVQPGLVIPLLTSLCNDITSVKRYAYNEASGDNADLLWFGDIISSPVIIQVDASEYVSFILFQLILGDLYVNKANIGLILD